MARNDFNRYMHSDTDKPFLADLYEFWLDSQEDDQVYLRLLNNRKMEILKDYILLDEDYGDIE